MREIKFRAWAKSFNQRNMINWVDIVENWGFSRIYDNSDFILMQFTGLKDKNGKEIYEGDIIICRDGKFVIEYEDRFAQFIMTNKKLVRDAEQLYEQDADTCMRSIEVIGNIYENPELLEESK